MSITWTDNVTPLNAVNMNHLVQDDEVVAAASRIMANKLASGDSQPAFRIMGDGKIEWGAGGATDPDVNLYRLSSTALKSDAQIWAAHLVSNGNVHVDWGNIGGGVTFGSAQDTRLYRAGVNVLATSGDIAVAVTNDGLNHGLRFYDVNSFNYGGIYRHGTNGDLYIYGQTSIVLTPDATGRVYFSDKTSQARDTNLYRSAAGVLKCDQNFRAGLDLYAQDGGATQVRIGNNSGAASIDFGSAMDTRLYRAQAGQLWTPGSLVVGSSIFPAYNAPGPVTGLDFRPAAGTNMATSSVLQSVVNGEAGQRFILRADGAHNWGPGGAAAVDTSLARGGVNQLQMSSGGTLWAVGTNGGFVGYNGAYLNVIQGSANAAVLFGSVLGDSPARFAINASGRMDWGPGNAAQDTNLYRQSAGTLRTDGVFVVGGNLVIYGTLTPLAPVGQAWVAAAAAGDSQYRFSTQINGTMYWGPGNAAQDVNLYRWGVDFLKTDDNFVAAGGIYTDAGLYAKAGINAYNGDAFWQTTIGYWSGAPGPGIAFSSAQDVSLYRGGADLLRTDDQFLSRRSVATDAAFIAGYGSSNYWYIRGDGAMNWGTGSSYDTNLYRSAAGVLKTDGGLDVAWKINVGIAQAAGNGYLAMSASGDTQNRFVVYNTGTMNWGPGNASADVNLYRNTTTELSLRTNGNLNADGAVRSYTGNAAQISLTNSGAIPVIYFGNAFDTNLFRNAANSLMTDDIFYVAGENPGGIVTRSGLSLNFYGVNARAYLEVGAPDSGGAGYRMVRILN